MITFDNVEFEDDETFIKIKKDEMRHVKKLDEYLSKRPVQHKKQVIVRPNSAQSKLNTNPTFIEKAKSKPRQTKPKSQLQVSQITKPTSQLQTNQSVKSVKFSQTYFSEKTPVIREYFDNSDAYQSDAPTKSLRAMPTSPKLEIFSWQDDDDLDDQFYIKNVKISNTPIETDIERKNRETFLSKFKIKPQSIEVTLKQQQEQIQKKKEDLKLLQHTYIIQNNLVLSKVPAQQDEVDEYANEKFEKEDDEYQDDFEKGSNAASPTLSQQKAEIKPVNKPKKGKKPKKRTYRPRNKEQRKEEYKKMRLESEQYQTQNNPHVKKLFEQWHENEEKEKLMIDISTKRREQLQNAEQTLKQLEEKVKQQQLIIEELKKKETYSGQIIDHLKSSTEKYQQLYKNEINKMYAGKIIMRYLIYYRDRMRFLRHKHS
ncbi:hypothetical protein pb186bvf_001410 [Paramecium bursaria]